ncbi:hypothetical protein LSS_01044 [Leptospira santarosai serovar Shermani str. LT 821]|uniref:Uncharacterized protein n=1 Tax=Leptospira santarosai serovar Shermani str. LT 821 TaxID=758847 RepID=K8Y5H3_9LEPT|nr:hypothetical protein LSS_01044 [Leptospira santarosai serovar Shermani str. LT 821]
MEIGFDSEISFRSEIPQTILNSGSVYRFIGIRVF